MKGLIIALFIWGMFGQWAYGAFPHYVDLISSVTMLLCSLIVVTHFKNKWWGLILLISFPTFFYRLSVFLYLSFSLPINEITISWTSIYLSLASLFTILIFRYLPKWS